MAATHTMDTGIPEGWTIVAHPPGIDPHVFLHWTASDEAEGVWKSCWLSDLTFRPQDARGDLCYKAFSDSTTAMAFKMRFC